MKVKTPRMMVKVCKMEVVYVKMLDGRCKVQILVALRSECVIRGSLWCQDPKLFTFDKHG